VGDSPGASGRDVDSLGFGEREAAAVPVLPGWTKFTIEANPRRSQQPADICQPFC
jgi:hypothetical protein